MKYRLVVLLLVVVLLLCAINAYIIVSSPTDTKIRDIISLQVKKEVASLPLPQVGAQGLQGIPGRDGRDGVSTLVERKIETREVIAHPEKGEKGDRGDDGADARQIVLDRDPDTGDIVWRYEGDTLWNLLIEKCDLTKCGEQ